MYYRNNGQITNFIHPLNEQVSHEISHAISHETDKKQLSYDWSFKANKQIFYLWLPVVLICIIGVYAIYKIKKPSQNKHTKGEFF